MNTMTLALIGLGKIAIPKDASTLMSKPARDHLSAIIQNNINITYICDIDTNKAELIKSQHGHLAKAEIIEPYQIAEKNVDIVTISTPPNNRLKDIEYALTFNPKHIVLEKPIASDYKEAHKIAQISKEKGVNIFINFPRIIDNEYRELNSSLDLNKNTVSSIYKYSKGLENYCSHHIQSFLDWYGEPSYIQCISDGDNPSFTLTDSQNRKHYFLGFDQEAFDIFDTEITLKDQVINIDNGGCEKSIRKPVDGLYYEGYKQLGKAIDLFPRNKIGGFFELYECVKSNNSNLCTIDKAVIGVKIIDLVKKSKSNNYKVLNLNTEV